MKKFNLQKISVGMLLLLSLGLTVFAQNESEIDKANRLEMEKKVAEINQQNLKLIGVNENAARVFKAGSEALAAKRYDEAIKFFDEGLTFIPEEPVFLINKSIALTRRGAASYNNTLQLKDAAAKNSALGSAHKDWLAAVETSRKAVEILKAESAKTLSSEDEAAIKNITANIARGNAAVARRSKTEAAKRNLPAALHAKAEAVKLIVEKVDKTYLSEAIRDYQELLKIEQDSYLKNRIQRQIAKLYFSAEDFPSAKSEYRRVLVNEPDDLEANFNFALAVVATEDKIAYKEAATALQRFLDKAPQNHPLRTNAQEVMQLLKSQ